MSYSEFSFVEVIDQFGLVTEERMGIFADVPDLEPSFLLKQILTEYFPLLRASDNEKLRSEAFIFPLLADLRKQLNQSINLFSGIDFNVDVTQGLNGYCDFLMTQSSETFAIRSPVIIVVEAKKEDINGGLGQCLAEMVAAQIFNEKKGDSVPAIYGTVTTGTNWLFLKLEGKTAIIDLDEYSIKNPSKILGILASAVSYKNALQSIYD
ncbi:MAG: hypothetical protein DSM106950_20665 [Stigonema ocellatum SAG 48.90 = DSM 106950]|nr:hypothetical protein [Stigonema ocellatum SAG 48.90 = DSM 106950]